MSTNTLSQLKKIAESSLKANVVESLEGPALRAGAHQFSSLWTRDLCFAVPGLVAAGLANVAHNHIGILLRSVGPEGQVPRILDDGASVVRVVRWTIGRKILPRHLPSQNIKKSLRREYVGEHKTWAFDSGSLLFLSAFYVRWNWSETSLAGLQRIFEFYKTRTSNFTKVMVQPKYSDWQDSARREGPLDFNNYLILRMLKVALVEGLATAAQIESFEKVFRSEFLLGANEPATSLHSVRKGVRQIALETHLFRIQDLLTTDKDSALKLWRALKDHPLFHRAAIPGVPVDPEYANDEISFFTKAVGLKHYHDRMCWTWLSAEAAKTAVMVGDRVEADRIFKKLSEICGETGDVPEILDPVSMAPFENVFYRSEAPFSWGAAKILEAIAIAGG